MAGISEIFQDNETNYNFYPFYSLPTFLMAKFWKTR